MALESGNYTIISQFDSAFVGRSQIEPEDISPKPIFKLSKESGSTASWEVERLENGNYTFKARGSIVGAIGGLLFAIIVAGDISKATIEWTLNRDERDTDGNAYVVMVAGQQVGWVAPAGDGLEQIAIEQIFMDSTTPPTFSPSEVFVFKKSEEQA